MRQRDIEMDKALGVDGSYLCYVDVPPEYVVGSLSSIFADRSRR